MNFKAIIVAAGLAIAALSAPANAASLGLTTDTTVGYSTGFFDILYVPDVLADGNGPAANIASPDFVTVNINGVVGSDGSILSPFALNVGGTSGLALAGTFSAIGFTQSAGLTTIEILFDVVGGSDATIFGTQALATITSFLAVDFATSFVEQGTSLAINPVIAMPDVPLPASAVLLLMGVGAFGVARRRKT